MRFLAVRRDYAPSAQLRHLATTHGYHNRLDEVCCRNCGQTAYIVYGQDEQPEELSLCIDWLDCELPKHCGQHLDVIETPDLRFLVAPLSA